MSKKETDKGPSPDRVRDVSEAVYRMRLGPDDTARMIAKDGDKGEQLRGRAGSYDTLTRAYMKVLNAV